MKTRTKIKTRLSKRMIADIENLAHAKSHNQIIEEDTMSINNHSDNSLYKIEINAQRSELFHAVMNNYQCGDQTIPIYGVNYTGSIN